MLVRSVASHRFYILFHIAPVYIRLLELKFELFERYSPRSTVVHYLALIPPSEKAYTDQAMTMCKCKRTYFTSSIEDGLFVEELYYR